MVFVISKDGEILMPTKRYRKVRQWLSKGQAKVISSASFTMQLLFETQTTLILIIIGCLWPWQSFAGKNNTPNWWRCEHKVSGEFAFGRIAYACDVASFGEDNYVANQYSSVVFDDAANRNTETKRYMQSLYSTLRDGAKYYIQSRNANVSDAEISAWQEAIYAMVYQETWWSHYRKSTVDDRMKMIRGDIGHGHGLVQVDDRWHYTTLINGGDEGWNLSANMTYGFGIIYSGWKKSKYNKSCINSTSSWEDRARAAYSAHNAGIGSSCRWATSNDRRDSQFLDKFRGKDWLAYVNHPQGQAPIDIACLMEENGNCNSPSSGGSTKEDWGKQILLLSDGAACLYHQNTLHCVDTPQDAICLATISPLEPTSIIVSDSAIANIARQDYNRHKICQEVVEALQPVGSMISLAKNINQREKPDGTLIQTMPSGGAYQVLDFVLIGQSDNDIYRYYRVRYKNKDGYIYAGNKTSYASWITETTIISEDLLIGLDNNTLKIVKSSGINFRKTPGGEQLSQVPVPLGKIFKVNETYISTAHNKVYYHIDYNTVKGWIYGGWVLPDTTLQNWVTVTASDITPPPPPPPEVKKCIAGNDFYYEYLRDCNSKSCAKVSNAYLVGGKLDALCQRFGCNYTRDIVTVIEEDQGNWSKVNLDRVTASAWINNKYLLCP